MHSFMSILGNKDKPAQRSVIGNLMRNRAKTLCEKKNTEKENQVQKTIGTDERYHSSQQVKDILQLRDNIDIHRENDSSWFLPIGQ